MVGAFVSKSATRRSSNGSKAVNGIARGADDRSERLFSTLGSVEADGCISCRISLSTLTVCPIWEGSVCCEVRVEVDINFSVRKGLEAFSRAVHTEKSAYSSCICYAKVHLRLMTSHLLLKFY